MTDMSLGGIFLGLIVIAGSILIASLLKKTPTWLAACISNETSNNLSASNKSTLLWKLILLSSLSLPILAYSYWGNWGAWQKYCEQQRRHEKAAQLLRTLPSTDVLIAKLREQLHANPDSARGWYLLGRVYRSQQQWLLASQAFHKAYSIHENKISDPKLAAFEAAKVSYAESLWQLNQRQFDTQIRILYQKILDNNPQQPDALTMLAMDAYARHDYMVAIGYWQQLLKLVPDHSEEARSLQKAIAKAKKEYTH